MLPKVHQPIHIRKFLIPRTPVVPAVALNRFSESSHYIGNDVKSHPCLSARRSLVTSKTINNTVRATGAV